MNYLEKPKEGQRLGQARQRQTDSMPCCQLSGPDASMARAEICPSGCRVVA